MTTLPPFYDLSLAGSMAANVCSQTPQEAVAPLPDFSAAPAPCPPPPVVAGAKRTGWRRVADAALDLVSGPRLEPAG